MIHLLNFMSWSVWLS